MNRVIPNRILIFFFFKCQLLLNNINNMRSKVVVIKNIYLKWSKIIKYGYPKDRKNKEYCKKIKSIKVAKSCKLFTKVWHES